MYLTKLTNNIYCPRLEGLEIPYLETSERRLVGWFPGSSTPAGPETVEAQYHRGTTLGGLSVVNSGPTLPPRDSAWEYIKIITGDTSLE